MGDAIAAVLTYAAGVGLSPIPAIAVIIVLFSVRAKVNGPLFMAGWMGGLAALVTGVHLMADQLGAGEDETTDDGIAWIRVLLGVVLLVAAARKLRKRQQPGVEPSLPGWMARIEGVSPSQAFGVGVLLSANPKNLALAVAAGLNLAQIGLSAGQVTVGVVVFVLVGSAAVIAAVAYSLVGGDGARQRLGEVRTWLTLHNSAVMAVMYVVFGTLLISRGLSPYG